MDGKDAPARTVGQLVRRWRKLRDMSQAALADRTGISIRHLSFIETGRSLPSRDMLDWLSQALVVPDDEYHALLEAGGYFAGYDPSRAGGTGDEDDGGDTEVREQSRRIVRGLMPTPAVIHDVYGTLVCWNDAFEAMLRVYGIEIGGFGGFQGGHGLVAALQGVLTDWHNLARLYLRRVHDELLRSRGEVAERLEQLLLRLLDGFPNRAEAQAALDRRDTPPLVTSLHFEDPPLSFDAFTTTLGTPPRARLRMLRMLILMPHTPQDAERVDELVRSGG